MAARRIKVLVVLGTRPEAIKLAPVIAALRADRRFRARVCVTAQHREMLDQALAGFAIAPDIDLDLMRARQEPPALAAAVLRALGPLLRAERPRAVIVQGDTTTAFAAALAAFHQHVPVAHVEAGLRTRDRRAPFPEEINRRLLAVLADFHFAPTAGARRNLLASGIDAGSIWVTGNTGIDALLLMRRRLRQPGVRRRWLERFRRQWELDLEPDRAPLVLVTGHRRESFGEPLRQVCLALIDIARGRQRPLVVYPVHLNPAVRRPVRALLRGEPGIRLLEPLAYEPFVFLMDRARLVLTDSGGIQEEAPVLGKPVLVLRRETERREGVRAGNAEVLGLDRRRIARRVGQLLAEPAAYRRMARAASPYGDGRAAGRIVSVLARRLEET